MQRSVYKDPNGKLLKVALEQRDGVIVRVTLTGDFFLYPEEAIDTLQNALAGAPLHAPELARRVQNALKRAHATPFGLTPEGVAQAVLAAASAPEEKK